MSLHLPLINQSPSANRLLFRDSSSERFQTPTPSRFNQYAQQVFRDQYKPQNFSSNRRTSSLSSPFNQNVDSYEVQSPYGYPREVNFGTQKMNQRTDIPHSNQQQQLAYFQAKRAMQQQIGDLVTSRSRLSLVPFQPDPSSFPERYSPSLRNLQPMEIITDHPLMTKMESTFKRAYNQEQEEKESRIERYLRRQSTVLEKIVDMMGNSPKLEQRVYQPEIAEQLREANRKQNLYNLEGMNFPRQGQERKPTELRVKTNTYQKDSKRGSLEEETKTPSSMKTVKFASKTSSQGKIQAESEGESQKEVNLSSSEDEDNDDNSSTSSSSSSPKLSNKQLNSPQLAKRDSSGYGSPLLSIHLKKQSLLQFEGRKSGSLGENNSRRDSIAKVVDLLRKQTLIGSHDHSPNGSVGSGSFSSSRRSTYQKIHQRGSIRIEAPEEEKTEEAEDYIKMKKKSEVISQYRIDNDSEADKNEKKLEILPQKKTNKKAKEKKRGSEVQKKANTNIKNIMWLVLCIPIVYNEKKRNSDILRDNLDQNIKEKIVPTYEALKSYIIKVAGKEITALLLNKQFNLVFVRTKILPEKKLDKDITTFKEQFEVIFKNITNNMSSLSKPVIRFLSTLSENGSVLPSNYFSEFELNRLEFGSLGTLRKMDPEKSKLIIGGITLVRVLIHMIIMQPWNTFNMSHDKFNIEKLLNIGSVLYNVVMELFKVTTPLIENSQKSVPFTIKVSPKKKTLNVFAESSIEKGFVIRKDLSRDGEILAGLYSKQQLACFFSERKRIVQELKEMMQECLDAFYEKTHNQS